MHIACLHTAAVHIDTFTGLFDAAAPDAKITHVVREDLLADAQKNGAENVRDATVAAMQELQSADAILCSCSTLGPLVDAMASDKIVRIDRPVMVAAARHGARPILALCLESTRDASLALLIEAGGAQMTPTVHLCDGAWPFFEAGDMDGFAKAIAASLTPVAPGHDCIVLGQASMRVAEPALAHLGLPVLSSPALAVQAAIAVARG